MQSLGTLDIIDPENRDTEERQALRLRSDTGPASLTLEGCLTFGTQPHRKVLFSARWDHNLIALKARSGIFLEALRAEEVRDRGEQGSRCGIPVIHGHHV